MGPEVLHAKAAQQEGSGLDSYHIRMFKGHMLPGQFKALVYSRWLHSLKHGNDFFKLMDSNTYYAAYHDYIEKILGKLEAEVRFATLTDDPDVVLGFSVCRGNILDYVHVHKDQYRQGIATTLVPSRIDTITHVTNTGLTIWASKYPKWKFNPFA